MRLNGSGSFIRPGHAITGGARVAGRVDRTAIKQPKASNVHSLGFGQRFRYS